MQPTYLVYFSNHSVGATTSKYGNSFSLAFGYQLITILQSMKKLRMFNPQSEATYTGETQLAANEVRWLDKARASGTASKFVFVPNDKPHFKDARFKDGGDTKARVEHRKINSTPYRI